MSDAHKGVLDDVSPDNFLKHQFLVNSRAFLINYGCGYKESTTVPYADMVNHSGFNRNVEWKFCPDR